MQVNDSVATGRHGGFGRSPLSAFPSPELMPSSGARRTSVEQDLEQLFANDTRRRSQRSSHAGSTLGDAALFRRGSALPLRGKTKPSRFRLIVPGAAAVMLVAVASGAWLSGREQSAHVAPLRIASMAPAHSALHVVPVRPEPLAAVAGTPIMKPIAVARVSPGTSHSWSRPLLRHSGPAVRHPSPRACIEGGWCGRDEVLRADANLRTAYQDAVTAGAPRSELVSIRNHWAHLRETQYSDPRRLLASYAALTSDLQLLGNVERSDTGYR